MPASYQSLGERMSSLWQRGVRFATRVAIAFGISTAAGIGVGAAVTDNGFVQIAVTILAAFGFWLPILFLVLGVERAFNRRRLRRSRRTASESDRDSEHWSRLMAVAPDQVERVTVLQRSLERSRAFLGTADLDPDAHDLCVLIDRRLPELVVSELDNLAPDDRTRSRQIGELFDLIEQFARHCSRRQSGDGPPGYDSAVLRRRFEARLSGQ